MNQEQNLLHFGLIGCGAWGSHHARVIDGTSGVQLSAIADCLEQNRAAAGAIHKKTKLYADYTEMLQKEKFLHEACSKNNMDLLELTTDKPFISSLLSRIKTPPAFFGTCCFLCGIFDQLRTPLMVICFYQGKSGL